ncbi:MAG: tetratricopeptide repeat protein [Candidatus Heimdallarchaeota archaeon]|nr:MAG: tetratricopeptide repeat protein [Candidatus Heimdallarchaeota archaeon]
MNQDAMENLYVTGNYSSLLEKITNLAYNDPSSKLTDIEKAIYLFYHSRALIRLGEVNDAEILLRKFVDIDYKAFFVSSLINQISVINLQITQGKVNEAIENGKIAIELVEQKNLSNYPQLSFWSPFLYYFIGIAYFYHFKNDLAWKYFQKSLDISQTNLLIKAKSLYYMAFLKLEKGDTSKFFALLNECLEVYHAIDAKQGIAWVGAWLGQYFLQRGDFSKADLNFTQALELFKLINDVQGLNLVNSLIGLMFYQQGKLRQAESMLEKAFDSSIEIGNPMILSYCVIPLILLYIESGNRVKAQKCINQLKEVCKDSTSDRVKVHSLVTEAIFLKSSSRFSDKAQAQNKFLELLNEDGEKQSHGSYVWLTSDKSFSYLVITHLAELYLEEFKLSEDNHIMLEVRELIDNQIQKVDDQKFSPELVELSLLQAKLLIVEGDIKEALSILERAKLVAKTNNFRRMEEKIGFEIKRIDREFKKWDAAALSVRDRIKRVQIEEYLKEVQKMITLQHQG